MNTGTEPLKSTLDQVRSWSRSLQRMESVLEQLAALEERPLARALGWLIARCVDQAEDPGTVMPGGGARTRAEQKRRDSLEILMGLAACYLEDGDEGRFTGDPALAGPLAREFLTLRHLDEDGDLPLLSASMNRCWREHRDQVLAADGADRLRQELLLLQLARSLYALAVGIPTFPEHLALAHQVGESHLNPSFQAASAGQLASAD